MRFIPAARELSFWDFTPALVLAVSLPLSLACAVRLWRTKTSRFERVLWTLFLIIPVLGPVFFAAMFRPPPAEDGTSIQHVNAGDGHL